MVGRTAVERALKISRLETRDLLTNPALFAVLVVMPGLTITFIKNDMVGGVDFALPGIATLFVFLVVSYCGYGFFKEHGWNTWDRLRSSPISSVSVVMGKALPYVVIANAQLTVMFLLGRVLLGMRLTGDVRALALVIMATSNSIVAMAVLLVALLRSVHQISTLSTVLAVVLGGIAGVFSAASGLPMWVSMLARLTPQFWAVEAFRGVVSRGAGVLEIAPNVAALTAFTVTFAGIATWRFDSNQRKRYWDG